MNQIITFQREFAEPVSEGVKTQTIRQWSEHRAKLNVGDTVYLRAWAGKARHSKQIQLGIGKVEALYRISWHPQFKTFAADPARVAAFMMICDEQFWRRDGFLSQLEMDRWFARRYQEEKEMIVIRWNIIKTGK